MARINTDMDAVNLDQLKNYKQKQKTVTGHTNLVFYSHKSAVCSETNMN